MSEISAMEMMAHMEPLVPYCSMKFNEEACMVKLERDTALVKLYFKEPVEICYSKGDWSERTIRSTVADAVQAIGEFFGVADEMSVARDVLVAKLVTSITKLELAELRFLASMFALEEVAHGSFNPESE